MKAVSTKKLSLYGTKKLLSEASKQVIHFHPNANYSASSTGGDMNYFVEEAIKHYGLNRKQHLQDLLIYRQKFEKAITKRYGVKFTYQLNEDVQTKYNVKRVPQHIQVQSGILDLLIGRLNTIHVDVSKLISDAA